MVAHPEMAPPALGEAEAGDEQGHPPEGTDPVDMLTRLHSAETKAAASTDAARPRAEDDQIGPDQLLAGGQGGVDIDRFMIAAESVAAGYGSAEQPLLPQLVHGPAVCQRQRGAIGHDIGDPAGRAVIFQHCRSRCNHAVQLADQHRQTFQTAEAGQPGTVAGSGLLAAEHPHLPGCVAELHDMAAAVKAGRRPVQIQLDKVTAPAAQG